MNAPAHARPPRLGLRPFLEDIRETPDDTSLRLILADWLEDQDNPEDSARAELIRLQCGQELAIANSRRQRREMELISAWSESWLGQLAERTLDWQFDRGLLRLNFGSNEFFSPEVEDVSRSEAFLWTDSIALHGFGYSAMERLAQDPRIAGVRELCIMQSSIGEVGLTHLAQSTHLGHVRVLRLAQARFGSRWPTPQRWPTMPHLHTLDLSQNYMEDCDLQSVLTSELPKLRHLMLSFNNISDNCMTTMIDLPVLEHLESLNLSGNWQISDTTLTRLSVSRLRKLDVSQSMPTPVGMRALGMMTTLEELGVDRCEFVDDHLRELALASGLPRLHTLRVGRSFLGDESLIALITSRPRPWRLLSLPNNQIGPRGIEVLAGSADVQGLQELNLASNQVGDDGAFALARSPFLRKLRWLDLSNNGLTEAGVRAVKHRFGRNVLAD